MARYLADLEKSKRLPTETVSLETLAATLAAAEDRLIHGDPREATRLLYGLVESPRYRPWQDTAPYQNAEFLLGRALARGGAVLSGERYLLRVLRRGPAAAYYVPAHRALVDLALQTRAYGRLLVALEELPSTGAPLPRDSQSERAYLKARVAYERGDIDVAQGEYAKIDKLSRLFPGAAYFRGLIAARQRHWAEARAAFCEIAGQKGQDRVAFNVDERFFALKDLARLALGRIAHERNNFDEAYYFYFSIPEESERLAEALFEAAWSMYEKGENDAARAFSEQFDKLFPQSPLRPEVALLRANLDVKSCAFDRARVTVAALLQTYAPIAAEVGKSLGDQARRQALVERLLSHEAALGPYTDADGVTLSLLKLDDRFSALQAALRQIDVDMAEATRSLSAWQELALAARSRDKVQAAPSSAEAAQLLAEVEALVPLLGADRPLNDKLGDLLLDVTMKAFPPSSAGPYEAEVRAAAALGRRLRALRAQMSEAAGALALASLRDLDDRLRAILRQGRLTHIDAVVGKKKKLEIEIANIYKGKLPHELFIKLQAEGAIGDDEEYWPFEGVHFSDEYENFR